jgi:hypothetical protein
LSLKICTGGTSKMDYSHSIRNITYRFQDLKDLLAKASPPRSGDYLAGVAATTGVERMAAKMCLADLPLPVFLSEAVIPYEADEVTRLIMDRHDPVAFAEISHLTVGDFRNWLLADDTDDATLARIAAGITPEMAAAVSKLMRNQDLILAAKKCRVVTRFRNTIGLPGRLSVRLQPNHPTDDLKGIAASMLDGLLYGCGDAVVGVNPATDNLSGLIKLLDTLDEVRDRFDIPTQSCVLTHITNTIHAIEQGAPVDLVFQSVAGTEKANAAFGIDLALLCEAREAALSLGRGTLGDNVMYFETIAVQHHALPLLGAVKPLLPIDWSVSPMVIAEQSRVALGDEIGELLDAKTVVVLIGERPGLSSPDSLGVYLTFKPKVGRTDAERNCISNIRPEGLTYAAAGKMLVRLLGDARRMQFSGIRLKGSSELLE